MQYHFNDFNGCLNQPFTLELNNSELNDSATCPLKLISVDRHPNSAKAGDHEAFSVVFRGDSKLALDQQIYRIKHDTLGDMELFIVPIGPDDKGMCYEAVFS